MRVSDFFSPERAWQTGAFPPPWPADARSILAHLQGEQEAGREVGRADLPDEQAIRSGSRIAFVPGAMDTLAHRDEAGAGAIAQAIRGVLARPDRRAVSRLYALLVGNHAINHVDETIALLSREPPVDAAKLETFFAWIVREAPDREPVKLAIAVLGLSRHDRHRDLFLLLGAHEEFTRYVATALTRTLPPGEAKDALRELVRDVHGWGRIDLVGRLAPGADEGFRHWLVREGYRNTIMDEYLAHTAATAGDLLIQLNAPGAADDRALLDGAAGILAALVGGGPAEDMSDYDDGAEATLTWLRLFRGSELTLEQAVGASSVVNHARSRLRAEDDTPSIWTPEEAAEVERLGVGLLQSEATVRLITDALREGDLGEYFSAKFAAHAAGIDPWPHAWDRQVRGGSAPHSGYWFDVMRTDDPERIDRVVALALDRLPLESLSTGPAEELGLGPSWSDHVALGTILQDLRRFPGKGWPLIETALCSPVTRNRHMAVRALAGWDKQAWPPDALSAIRRALGEEPNDGIRDRMAELLKPNTLL